MSQINKRTPTKRRGRQNREQYLMGGCWCGEVDAWFNTHSNPRALTTEAQVTDATGDPRGESYKPTAFYHRFIHMIQGVFFH